MLVVNELPVVIFRYEIENKVRKLPCLFLLLAPAAFSFTKLACSLRRHRNFSARKVGGKPGKKCRRCYLN